MYSILNKKKQQHASYIGLTSILCAFTLSINFCSKIAYCSLIFTFLALTANGIATWHGSKKAIISIILSSSTSFAALYNMKYYIAGKPITGLIAASLLAIGVSASLGVMFFVKLKRKYSFAASNGISLLLYAFLDGLIMALFFTTTFPMRRVCAIFYKEVAYTCTFALLSYLLLFIVVYLSRMKIKKHPMASLFIRQPSA